MRKKTKTVIGGSVNQSSKLFKQCYSMEIHENEEQMKDSQYEESIKYIMKSEQISRTEAIEIYDLIAMEDTKQTIDKLMKEGLVKVVGYNSDGEPKFGLTEFGKQCAAKLNGIKI